MLTATVQPVGLNSEVAPQQDVAVAVKGAGVAASPDPSYCQREARLPVCVGRGRRFAYAVVGPDGRSCDPEWSQTARAVRLQSPNGEQMRCR
jgi:hypothetical protein